MWITQPPAMIEREQQKENPEITRIRHLLINEKENIEWKEQMKKVEIRKIKDGTFAVVPLWKNISRFVDANAELILNLKPCAEDRFFQKTSKFAGYTEYKNKIWVYELYHLVDIVDWKPKPGAKPVDKFSVEYFDFWVSQNFYQDRAWIDIETSISKEWHYLPLDDETIGNMTMDGSMLIHDILSFKAHNQITEVQFKRMIADVQKWLPMQSTDTQWRYRKCGVYIREQDLKKWHEMGLIPRPLMEECLRLVQEREKKLFEKSQAKWIASLDIRSDLMKLGLETIDQWHSVAWVQFNTRSRANNTLQA